MYLFKTGQANEVLSQIHAHVLAHAHDLFLGSFFFLHKNGLAIANMAVHSKACSIDLKYRFKMDISALDKRVYSMIIEG